jgi:hypothetical protein
MTKFNGILSVLALALAMTACGYQGPDADEGDETQEGTPSDQKPPQKDGGAGAPASGGSDAGTGGKGTDAGSGGSPPVTTDAGSGGSPADAGSGGSDAGGSGGGDAGGGGSTQPDPVIVTGTCAMKFSTAYVGNSTTAEVRGNLPGATWSSGPTVTDTNADKYLEYSAVSIGAGFYDLTYMVPPSTWANLGDSTALKAMTPAAREFVNCNWWDPVALKTVSVSSPSCNVRIMVGGGCTISAAGNMKDFK